MKKYHLLFLFFFNLISFAQNSNLEKLSMGEFIEFTAVLDKNKNLNGYMAFYNKGKINKFQLKFEIIYLDKNLNKVLSNEIVTESIAYGYDVFMNDMGLIELYPKLDINIGLIFKLGKTKLPDVLLLDVKNNTIKIKMDLCYENNALVECPDKKSLKEIEKLYKEEKNETGKVYFSNVNKLNDGSYIVEEYYEVKESEKDNAIIKLDANKKEVWRYEYNKGLDKKDSQKLFNLYNDEHIIYFLEINVIKKEVTKKIIKLDLKTGKKVFETQLLDKNKSYHSMFYMESGFRIVDAIENFEDKIVLIGESLDKKSDIIGYFRMIIDKKTDEIKQDDLFFEDAKKYIKISNYGVLENGYSLRLRDLFFLKNGSVGLLFEKFKISFNNLTSEQVVKTTDLVYFNTDENYKLNDVRIFEKEKSKNTVSDYMFSQYINNGNDKVFFYKDLIKNEEGQKNWMLYINTIINGTFKQENIQISSKENFIAPYIAKEGYILLREYNKNSKYNEIRLERLNF